MSRATDLAEKLVGTCRFIDISIALNDNIHLIEEFDTLAFSCDGCGWWCDISELNNENGERFCDECIQ